MTATVACLAGAENPLQLLDDTPRFDVFVRVMLGGLLDAGSVT